MEELIKKLKLALEDAGTAEELKKFGIEPEQIEGIKDLKVPATLEEALQIREIRSEFDKKIAKSLATREENLKSEFDFVKKEQKKEEEKNTVTDPAMKALLDEFQALKTKLEEKEKAELVQTAAQKKASAVEFLKSKSIPGVYVNLLNLEEDLEGQMESVSKQFEDDGGSFKAPRDPNRPPQPRNPGTKNEPSKEEVEAFKLKV
jgi:predicted nuclease with TOPRIM domain